MEKYILYSILNIGVQYRTNYRMKQMNAVVEIQKSKVSIEYPLNETEKFEEKKCPRNYQNINSINPISKTKCKPYANF